MTVEVATDLVFDLAAGANQDPAHQVEKDPARRGQGDHRDRVAGHPAGGARPQVVYARAHDLRNGEREGVIRQDADIADLKRARVTPEVGAQFVQVRQHHDERVPQGRTLHPGVRSSALQ